MRLLGREKGGALAVIAHVERAWGISFRWSQTVDQVGVFKDTLTHLMQGKPVGSALEYFNSRYAAWASELSTTLRDVQFGLQVEPVNIASMWTAHNDARGYAIIGDPAVRLNLASAGSAAQERPTMVVQPVTNNPPLPPAPGNVDGGPTFSPETTEKPRMTTDQTITIATYTAAEPTAAERTLFAQTQVTPGVALDTTVFGPDSAGQTALLDLHSRMVGHAIATAGRRSTSRTPADGPTTVRG